MERCEQVLTSYADRLKVIGETVESELAENRHADALTKLFHGRGRDTAVTTESVAEARAAAGFPAELDEEAIVFVLELRAQR